MAGKIQSNLIGKLPDGRTATNDGNSAFSIDHLSEDYTWDEAKRLEALDRYAILDTGREPEFDDVAMLAADIMDAPIAVINMIAADRQWFKAEVGIGTDSLPLDASICRHAILQPGVFVVNDLSKDSRFDDNPLVHVAGGLRFYAGAILETPDGLPLGTVCVLDTKPRPDGASERQQRALKVLASQTMARLELRRSEAFAKEQQARAEKHSRRLSLLAKTSTLLLSSGDPASTVKAIYALVSEEIKIDFAFHYRCGASSLHLVAAAGLTAEQKLAASELQFGETVCGIVAKTRKAVYLTDIQASQNPDIEIARSLGVDSYFSLPLLAGDDLLGTISFGRKEGQFKKGELEALQTLSEQLASALERKESEEALVALNATLETRVAERTHERDRTWNNSRDLLLVVDTDGIFRATNPSWFDLLGWTTNELVGHSYLEFIHPDDYPSSQEALVTASNDPLPSYVNRYKHKNGSYRWISWVAAPEGALIYASGRDVTTERLRDDELDLAREALRQSQKMEAMGQLTGGVAHDFNNLLTPIVGALDILTRRGVGSEREQQLINGAAQSADRAKTLVQRLLAFARRQPLQAVAVDLPALVNGMADLIASTTGPQVEIVIEIENDIPPAVADANQVEMALLNLAVNARDAMPDGGKLVIALSSETRAGSNSLGLAAGNYIRISVKDTGMGMDAETARRAIEPFFSTKGVGKGTGLGLSMVHGLAAQLGGAVEIFSQKGLGTNISLLLPVSAAQVTVAEPLDALSAITGHEGVVLLVDDEPLVRMMTADMLAELGFTVVEANSAEHALDIIDKGLNPNLLMTDHLMPGMTGPELAQILISRLPDMRVVIVSGYAESDGIAADLPRLTKPFLNQELVNVLKDLV